MQLNLQRGFERARMESSHCCDQQDFFPLHQAEHSTAVGLTCKAHHGNIENRGYRDPSALLNSLSLGLLSAVQYRAMPFALEEEP